MHENWLGERNEQGFVTVLVIDDGMLSRITKKDAKNNIKKVKEVAWS